MDELEAAEIVLEGRQWDPCTTCNGTGWVENKVCDNCSLAGRTKNMRWVEARKLLGLPTRNVR